MLESAVAPSYGPMLAKRDDRTLTRRRRSQRSNCIFLLRRSSTTRPAISPWSDGCARRSPYYLVRRRVATADRSPPTQSSRTVFHHSGRMKTRVHEGRADRGNAIAHLARRRVVSGGAVARIVIAERQVIDAVECMATARRRVAAEQGSAATPGSRSTERNPSIAPVACSGLNPPQRRGSPLRA